MNSESKRAPILREVLGYINSDDWEQGDGFLIFGSDAYNKYLGIEHEDAAESSTFDEFLRRLATGIKKVGGAHDIARRISLSPVTLDYSKVDLRSFFKRLTPDERAQLSRTISAVLDDLVRNPKTDTGKIRNVSDDIDASLAAAAIDQLENSYRRLVSFDEVSTPAAFDGSEYFEEAHRCDLAGQKIAAAVLCRAVLETALIDRADRGGWIKSQTKTHQRSYIGAMLLEAKLVGLIDDSRYQKGLRIRDAGDTAIHGPLDFHQKFANKIAEIIDDTRAIIEDLFRPRPKD